MQTVCLFNSTSDLALASDCAPFRPPKGLRAMENDLALLPALCSEEEKEAPLCLTFDALDLAARRGGRTRALRLLPSAPGLPARCEAADIDLRRCLLRPWGWNRDVRLRALRAGLPELLPPARRPAPPSAAVRTRPRDSSALSPPMSNFPPGGDSPTAATGSPCPCPRARCCARRGKRRCARPEKRPAAWRTGAQIPG